MCEGTTWDRLEDNIKIDIKEMSCKNGKKIELNPMAGFCDDCDGSTVSVKGDLVNNLTPWHVTSS
jgi:Zn finger protein HypA/HybF involved in hydrogenase expression